MKIAHLLRRMVVLGCLFAGVVANAQLATTNGIVSALNFDGNVSDSAVGIESTSLLGGQFIDSGFGNLGRAIHFDGSPSQGVLLSDAPWLKQPFLTVAVWIRTSSTATMQIAAKGHYPDSSVEQWSLYLNNDFFGGPRISFVIKRNSGGLAGQGWYYASSPAMRFTNQWIFLTGTWDGTNEVLYVDGKQVGANLAVPPGGVDVFDAPGSPAGDIQIGRSTVTTPPYYFQGDMDQFKLYRRALSPAEVQALYLQEGGTLKYEAALASARVVNGFFVQADVVKGGYGYTNSPRVRIVGGGGAGAAAVANVTNFAVASITVTNPGSGYTNAPSVWIDAPAPIGATAESTIAAGLVTGIKLTYPGYGYTTAPVVSLVGGGGVGAVVEAVIVDGAIVGFNVLNSGLGYSSPPIVRIDPPASIPVPSTSIDVEVKSLEITLHVVPNHHYVLEGTSDFANWSQIGGDFVATGPQETRLVDVSALPGFFRIRDVSYNP